MRRNALLVVALALAAILVAWVVTIAEQPTYRARMDLVVGGPRGIGSPYSGASADPLTQTLSGLLRSERIAAEVVRRLGLRTTPPELISRLGSSALPQSFVLRVTYDDSSPGQAVRVLRAVGGVFTDTLSQTFGGRRSATQLTVSVFDPARALPGRVSPNTGRILAFAGALGLVLGLILAFIRQALDDRVRSPREAEAAFGLPLVGTLPRASAWARFQARISGKTPPESSGLWPALHLLRANLEYRETGVGGPTVVVTAADEHASAADFSMRLGRAMADAGQSVIYVSAFALPPAPATSTSPDDADSVSGVVENHRASKVDDEASGSAEMAGVGMATGRSAASAWPEGSSPRRGALWMQSVGRDESGRLHGERVVSALTRLPPADWVLVEAPPLLSSPDAYPLVRVANGVIVLATEGKVTRRAGRLVRATLRELGAGRTGLVLVDSSAPVDAARRAYG